MTNYISREYATDLFTLAIKSVKQKITIACNKMEHAEPKLIIGLEKQNFKQAFSCKQTN